MDINDTLTQRGKTHGDYKVHAAITQGLKAVIHGADNFSALTPSQKETLDMIAHKIGRILAGDPNVHDHWHDIAGYAQLVANQLTPASKET